MPGIGATSNYLVIDVIPTQMPLGPVETDNCVVLLSSADGLTARAGGGQALGTAINANITRFTTVATIADSATLPPSVPGMQLLVINGAANSMNVFPNPGGTTTEKINGGGANAAYALPGNNQATFVCLTAGQWWAAKVATA